MRCCRGDRESAYGQKMLTMDYDDIDDERSCACSEGLLRVEGTGSLPPYILGELDRGPDCRAGLPDTWKAASDGR